jgi:hypothetical protein
MALAILFPGTALSQVPQLGSYFTGNQALSACDTNNAMNTTHCTGYVAGVVDAILLYQSLPFVADKVCIPHGVPEIQAKDVVVQYLKAHADQRHLPAAQSALAALTAAFPCNK